LFEDIRWHLLLENTTITPPIDPDDEQPQQATDLVDDPETNEDDSADEAVDQAEVKQYSRAGLLCDLADSGLDVVYLSIMAFFAARPLDEWLTRTAGFESLWTRLAIMFLVVTGVYMVVSFPLSYYSGHVLEHKYGMSRMSSSAWLGRYAKRNLLALGFGVLLIEGLYCLIWLVGPYWWLAAGFAFFLVSIALGQLMPVLILPLFYKIERLDDQSLVERFATLAAGTGLAIEGVYRMSMSDETAKANAMLAGLGRTRRVILGDTLLDSFSLDEIGVVLAHEIGHHVHRHIHKLMLFGFVYSIAGLYLCDVILVAWVGTGTAIDYSQFPVATLPMMLLSITLFSLLVQPLQNGISRHFERQADRYALDRTEAPDAFRSAFRKLAKVNKADPDPHPLEVFLMHSHPPITERLAQADNS